MKSVRTPSFLNTSDPHHQFKQSIGEFYIYGNTVAQSVASGTWDKLIGLTKGNSWGVIELDDVNDCFIINKHGRFLVNLSVSFSGSGGVVWNGGFFINDVLQENVQARRKLGATGDVGVASISGILELNVGDRVCVKFEHDEGVPKNITVVDCNLSMIKIW